MAITGLKFPKAKRLLRRAQFKAVSKDRRRYLGKALSIHWRAAPASRLGITVPRTYGKAHERNLFKRRLREVFRTHQHESPPVELVIFPQKDGPFGYDLIKQDLMEFYELIR